MGISEFFTASPNEGTFMEAWHRGSASSVDSWNQPASSLARYGQVRSVPGIGKSFFRGAASAFLPIEPMPHLMKGADEIAARERQILGGAKKTAYERFTKTAATRTLFRGAARTAGRWVGPLITGHRLVTETRGLGVAGGLNKGVRIIGEEAISTGSMVAGMALGGKVGAGLGTMVAPGLGSAIGTVAGIAIGAVIGHYGGKGWNSLVDMAEMPFRIAESGWKYLEQQGKQSSKLELGGGMSRGNRSQHAYTMRQRALSQMNRSGVNARSLLGMEASMMHIR